MNEKQKRQVAIMALEQIELEVRRVCSLIDDGADPILALKDFEDAVHSMIKDDALLAGVETANKGDARHLIRWTNHSINMNLIDSNYHRRYGPRIGDDGFRLR